MRKFCLHYLQESGRRIRDYFSSHSLIPALLCLPLGILAAVVGRFAVNLRYVHYEELLTKYPALKAILPPTTMPLILVSLAVVCVLCACVFLLSSLVGLIRKDWALSLLRKGYVAVYVLLIFYAYVVFSITGEIEANNLEVVGTKADAVAVFFWRFEYLWPAVCVAVFLGILHLLSWQRSTLNLYTGSSHETPAPGDKILENIRTHGKDPKFRKSTLASLGSHILVIIIIPLLLEMYGCVEPYRAPFGGGNPVIQMVRIAKPKKKKRKKYILRPDSAIYFRRPDFDDSKLLQQVEEDTRLTYQADASSAHGKIGDGAAGVPGWADGFKDGKVRFIRLEYSGENWDDGMDSLSRADMNFLEQFKQLSGGMKIAGNSESHRISLLKKYPKGQAPPFVYMTGSGGIHVSDTDLKILRDYLQDGGMLFADCGSYQWDRSFRSFIMALFPGNSLRIIADDDPIFQMPFGFANGAPPLWHHGGTRAMGIKHKDRWIVFYHPGDINDAWKTGHSGIDQDLARKSYQLGVNVVYYAFMRYLEETRKYRK